MMIKAKDVLVDDVILWGTTWHRVLHVYKLEYTIKLTVHVRDNIAEDIFFYPEDVVQI